MSLNLIKFKENKPPLTAGFTMLEMLMVTGIVLMISGIVIAYLPQFRDRSALDLVAQEMALNVRSAQAFASSGRIGIGDWGGVTPSYGLYLERGIGKESFMFADKNGNGIYDNDNDEKLEIYNLRGVFVEKIILYNDGSNLKDVVNITYTRPSLQAQICADNCNNTYNQADIYLKGSRDEAQKIITVHFNGQIAVANE